MFRGRENAHKDLGEKMLRTMADNLKATAIVEGRIVNAGNRMMMTLIPK